MKFFLDENFPKAAAGMLESLGHVVFDLRGTDREGSRDADVFAEAQRLEALFLTTDRDFFHTIPHLFPVHAGVIVIALRQPNRGRANSFL
jgi:predicted nuclease of predicted toxin-antitoxin system